MWLPVVVGLSEASVRQRRALANIEISDDVRDYQIPLGSKAQVAIYTEHLYDISLLRKILLRSYYHCRVSDAPGDRTACRRAGASAGHSSREESND
jgi:hypothetical protein